MLAQLQVFLDATIVVEFVIAAERATALSVAQWVDLPTGA
jgi:hypothetical protein